MVARVTAYFFLGPSNSILTQWTKRPIPVIRHRRSGSEYHVAAAFERALRGGDNIGLLQVDKTHDIKSLKIGGCRVVDSEAGGRVRVDVCT